MTKDLSTHDDHHYPALLSAIKARIHAAQYAALRAVNQELVGLYWDIGRMIVERQQREGWGKAVVAQLSADLRAAFPGMRGFSTQNLWYMRQFFQEYSDLPKLQPLVGEIGWAHNLLSFSRCKDPQQREFYLRMTRRHGWSKNVLAHQIDNQSYEKSLLGQNNFAETLPPMLHPQAALAVRDEYIFDFLALGETHSERELERALVAVELKIGEFAPEYVGKMQFYLAALDAQVRQSDENPSIGIILCKEKSRTIVEYALRDARQPIGVATYHITRTLPQTLQSELPDAATIARLLEGM
ncbi:MAG: PDDEXK nuclease domain-containing protein [Cardiobacteriaceae bacterium]|nr:PDDEXK nuclease domain-containing protein [Cardiobacteriaceae bacterium]